MCDDSATVAVVAEQNGVCECFTVYLIYTVFNCIYTYAMYGVDNEWNIFKIM